MTQAAVEFGGLVSDARLRALLAGLGIGETELDRRAPAQIVSTSHSKVLLPLGSKDVLDA